MLTFKGLPSASPIPRASKLSAKCVVVVTRPRTARPVWFEKTLQFAMNIEYESDQSMMDTSQ